MLWLWILERRLGAGRFLLLYLASAVGGAFLVYAMTPTRAAIGASGAIFGLAAAYFVLTRKTGGSEHRRARPVLLTYLVWMVVSMGFTAW
jgi:membrane associated rhomboid family serine protease